MYIEISRLSSLARNKDSTIPKGQKARHQQQADPHAPVRDDLGTFQEMPVLTGGRWLAAEANDLAEKRNSIEAMLKLDHSDERVWWAWLWVLQEQTGR